MSRKKKKRVYDDDDGRTIADMSEVRRPNVFGFEPFIRRGRKSASDAEAGGTAKNEDRPWEDKSLNDEETGHFILGALGAGLLVGLIFIAAAAILITLLLLFWK